MWRVWTGKRRLVIIMYSTALVNQFENKTAWIKFVINSVSAQGNNNAKIKLNLKMEKSAEIAVLFFCEINDKVPGFYLVESETFCNTVEHLVSIFCKNSQRLNKTNYFWKTFHLRCLTGFWITLHGLSRGFYGYQLLRLPLWVFEESF